MRCAISGLSVSSGVKAHSIRIHGLNLSCRSPMEIEFFSIVRERSAGRSFGSVEEGGSGRDARSGALEAADRRGKQSSPRMFHSQRTRTRSRDGSLVNLPKSTRSGGRPSGVRIDRNGSGHWQVADLGQPRGLRRHAAQLQGFGHAIAQGGHRDFSWLRKRDRHSPSS